MGKLITAGHQRRSSAAQAAYESFSSALKMAPGELQTSLQQRSELQSWLGYYREAVRGACQHQQKGGHELAREMAAQLLVVSAFGMQGS